MQNFYQGKYLLFFILLNYSLISTAQQGAYIGGQIRDTSGKALPYVSINAVGTKIGTVSDQNGQYKLQLPAAGNYRLRFSFLGYHTAEDSIQVEEGTTKTLDKVMEPSIKNIDEVFISGNVDRTSNLTRIDTRLLSVIPNTSGNIETILKTLPGVSSNNELSSQYSVRGGNFDENLVYINDIEIYRPFLIRSGQQEGLSFINPDLVSSLNFSAGGFGVSYGDKMSSVLDITYKRPTEFGGSVSASLLGGSFHLEGMSKDGRFSQITGVRYKTSQYLLSSMDTKGEYKPIYGDIQTNLSYRLTKTMDLSFLGNFSRNQYSFIPVTRETQFGTFNNSFQLKIYYDGNELDRYDTWFGALSLNFHPTEKLNMKLIASGYTSTESETFDIQGQYLINELDTRAGSKTSGDSILNIGVGTFLDHARNYLDVNVITLSHIGNYFGDLVKLRWGLKVQQESVTDHLNEWNLVDSAGYSLPYSGKDVNLINVVHADNQLLTHRATGFFQSSFSIPVRQSELLITAGLRSIYWDYSRQLLVDPRLSMAFSPAGNDRVQLRLAAGLYDQPPFYKEMRFKDGHLNPQIKAQESFHLVGGGDYLFKAADRPFKFTTEVYYKQFWNLIPYKVDNVRVIYAALNEAKGYATGIDFKVNGEFVKDAESWASLSIMRTREDISGDFYFNQDSALVYPGYYPRPTDQLINFGLYFQDYLPSNPSYRVSLYFLYGGRLPFSAPMSDRYDQVYRMPAYKRVDIGFIKVIKEEGVVTNQTQFLRPFKSVLLTGEIFNLLGNQNVISYLWVKTVSNLQGIPGLFAVPNYLTSRRFNIKITFRF